MEAGSRVRMEAALRVLTTHCDLGKTVTPEDEENVRWWAGNEALSPTEAATVVIQREIKQGVAVRSLTPPCECAGLVGASAVKI